MGPFLIASKKNYPKKYFPIFFIQTTFHWFYLKNSPVFQTKSLSKKENRKCLFRITFFGYVQEQHKNWPKPFLYVSKKKLPKRVIFCFLFWIAILSEIQGCFSDKLIKINVNKFFWQEKFLIHTHLQFLIYCVGKIFTIKLMSCYISLVWQGYRAVLQFLANSLARSVQNWPYIGRAFWLFWIQKSLNSNFQKSATLSLINGCKHF